MTIYGELPESLFDETRLEDALKVLEEHHPSITDDPSEPGTLPVEGVQTLPVVFQVRGEEVTPLHVGALLAVLKRGEQLDPILVWRVGRHAILIDGHHRLEAYRDYQRKADGRKLHIPVVWFHGTPEKAMKEAARANVPAKLQMDHRQRANLAWRFVKSDRFSKREIVTLSGVSLGLVATMRKAKVTLGADAATYKRWSQALHVYKQGKPEMSIEDREAWVESQGKELADKMLKHFGTKPTLNPEILAYALDYYCGRKSPDVIAEWQHVTNYAMEPDDDPDDNRDF